MDTRKVVRSLKSTSVESIDTNDNEHGQDKPVDLISTEVDPSAESSSKKKTYQSKNLTADVNTKKQPDRHMRLHKGEKPYKCTQCEESFHRTDILRSHEWEHVLTRFPCRYCKDEFPTPNLLRTHAELVHIKAKKMKPTISASSTASTDRKDFMKTDFSNAHVAPHEPVQEMNDAQRKTNDDEIVNLQHEVASQPKQFSCSLCSKEFQTKSSYQNHCEVHHWKYNCEYCGRKMANSTSLKRHILSHTGQRPFQCEICNTKFTRGDKSHLRTHAQRSLKPTRNKPHKCDFCDRSYTEKFSLLRHMQLVHPAINIDPHMKRFRNKQLMEQSKTEVKSSVQNVLNSRPRAVHLKKQSVLQKAGVSTHCTENNIRLHIAPNNKIILKKIFSPSLQLRHKPLPQPTSAMEKVETKDEELPLRRTPVEKTTGSPPPPQPRPIFQMAKEPEQTKHCKVCNEEMRTDHDLTVHTFAFHPLKGHGKVCGICQKPCPSLHVLSRHYEYLHSGDKNAAEEAKMLLTSSNSAPTTKFSPSLVVHTV